MPSCLRTIALVSCISLLTGCHRPAPVSQGLAIGTATSYLEAAARDLVGDKARYVPLAEPGTCPGHFDIRPSQVQELRSCRALLRFNFQSSLDAKLASPNAGGPRICEVLVHGGMGSPKTYLDACRQVASHLTALGILARADAGARLKAIETRLEVLTRNATNRIAQARLCSTPVLVSLHQRDFCEWLGLRVVATFRPADTAAVSEIDEAIQAGMRASVKLVIANRPEGRRTADALAERLGARVVVFENFPALRDGRVSFDEMVMGNVELLSRAASVSQLAGVSLGPQDGPAEAQGRIILVVGRD